MIENLLIDLGKLLSSPILWGIAAVLALAIALSGRLSLTGAAWLVWTAWGMAVFGVYRATVYFGLDAVVRILTVGALGFGLAIGAVLLNRWFSPRPVQGISSSLVKHPPALPSTEAATSPPIQPKIPKHQSPKIIPIKAAAPELSARFIQAKSPGVILVNRSKAVAHDPSCYSSMWNLSRHPPLSLPSYNENNPGQFIKPGAELLLATLDNPAMKPLIAEGDRIFGFVGVDCSDCSRVRYYWLYVVYGHPTEAWYSEVPGGQMVNVLAVNKALEESGWDIDTFMNGVPHGERIIPQRLPEQ